MLTVLILCFFRFTCGFLLENGNSSIPGKQTYLTETKYYTDQAHLNQQLALQSQKIMDMASHSELNLLASQLQSKLDAFEQKLSTQTTSTSQTSVLELEQKYQVLEQKNKALEQALATKEQEMVELRQNQSLEMAELRQNLTLEMANLQQKIGDLEHLKSINQTQTLDNLDQKTQTLVTKVNALESTEQARSQDFVALYNEVKQQTTAMDKLENRTQRLQNESLNHLQQYIDGQLQPVILTACNESGSFPIEPYYPITFPNILTSVGIANQTYFQKTGRFRCSIPGYYYKTTTMETVTNHIYLSIMVNSVVKHEQHVTGVADYSYTPGSTGFTLHLSIRDEVWIHYQGIPTYFARSCFTIFKIK